MKKEHLIWLGIGALGVYLYVKNKKKKEASNIENVVIEEETTSEATGTGGMRKLYPNQCQTGKEKQCAELCAQKGGVLKDGYCVQGRRTGGIRRRSTRMAF